MGEGRVHTHNTYFTYIYIHTLIIFFMFANEQKKMRIEIIKNSIIKARKARKIITEKMILSEMGLDLGISRRTANEYLDELEDGGFIVRTEGELWLSDRVEEDLRKAWEQGLDEQKKIEETLNDASRN